jgi:hypothetical protein
MKEWIAATYYNMIKCNVIFTRDKDDRLMIKSKKVINSRGYYDWAPVCKEFKIIGDFLNEKSLYKV